MWAYIISEIESLSSITIQEYISLVSSWNYHTNTKQYNCKEQYKKFKTSEKLQEFKNRNGCDNIISTKPRQHYENITFYNCYCNHLDYSFLNLIGMYDRYQTGFLPYPGSAQEQPNKVIELFNIISKFKYEQELQNSEKSSSSIRKK